MLYLRLRFAIRCALKTITGENYVYVGQDTLKKLFIEN